MAEYKRWMAYLYNYENGFKRNCIGTARIERRGIEARTTVSIQVPSLSNERLKTFYYVRTKDGIRGIEVGEFTVNGTLGSWQVSMNANDMAGTGMRLENMDGFLICRDSSKYYASSWDERPVLPSEVHAVLQDYEQVRRAREASAGQNTQQQTGVAGVQHTEQRENSIRRESLPNEVTGSMQNKTTGSMQNKGIGSLQSEVTGSMQNEATGYLPTGRTEDMSARASESLSEGMDPGISNKTDRNMQMEINRRMSTEATENMPTGTGRSMQSEINRRMSTEATKNMPAGTTESIPTGEANEIHNDDITARQPWYDYSTESRETADDWRSYRTEEDNRERSVGQPSYPLDNTNQTEQIPDRVTESRTDRTTEGIPNRMTESRTDRATESTPDGTTGSRTDRASESILDRTTGSRTDRASESILDRTTESRTDRATENIPDRIVGSMSTETNGSMSVHTDMAKRIFESCPVIWPFSDPWADRCVKLELEDIGLLPVKLWQLTANSFLMHSYYGYRHLVLARKTESGRQTYELLVPGIYNERERELAELFGFRNFRCAKSRPVNVGEYGYWSMPVEFD